MALDLSSLTTSTNIAAQELRQAIYV